MAGHITINSCDTTIACDSTTPGALPASGCGDLPAEYGEYTQINADFFTELGSPGGASKVGLTENDPAAVKSLESRAEAT